MNQNLSEVCLNLQAKIMTPKSKAVAHVALSLGKESMLAAVRAKELFEEVHYYHIKTSHYVSDQEYFDYAEELLGAKINVIETPNRIENFLTNKPQPLPSANGMFLPCCSSVKDTFKHIMDRIQANFLDRDYNLAHFIVVGKTLADWNAQGVEDFPYISDSKVPSIKILSIIRKMTDTTVFAELKDRGIKVQKTYEQGFSKYSCFPCVVWSSPANISSLEKNVELLKEHQLDTYNYWVDWEIANNKPFFNSVEGEDIYLKDVLK